MGLLTWLATRRSNTFDVLVVALGSLALHEGQRFAAYSIIIVGTIGSKAIENLCGIHASDADTATALKEMPILLAVFAVTGLLSLMF